MIGIIGASGYVGAAFQVLFRANGTSFIPISRTTLDYYDSEAVARLIDEQGIDFLINAAGFTGKPNVDACERNKPECLMANAVLPGCLRRACEQAGIRWGHVSSGCIYTGPGPDGSGFRETDKPNFCFGDSASFYSGTKALGEEILQGADCYVWRLRMPFNDAFDSRNYLNKLLTYETLLDVRNSLSHLSEFVKACFQCFELDLPAGIYNLTNPGSVTTREITRWMEENLKPARGFKFFASEEEFMATAAHAPRSSCVLNTEKQTESGIFMTPVEEAVRGVISRWSLTCK